LEAKWAKWFDDNGIRWIYEPEGFQKDGIKYLPDFALPDLHIIFEAKGVIDDKDEKKRKMMLEICDEIPWLYIIGFNVGEMYYGRRIEVPFDINSALYFIDDEAVGTWRENNENVFREQTNRDEAVLLMIDELLIVYILHDASREKIKKIAEKYNSTIPENYLLFFKESEEKFNAEDFLEQLKSYFGSEKIRLLKDYMKRYDGTENYLSIINDVENELQVKEIRRKMDKLGEKIKEAETEEEKLPIIEKYLGLSKQLNKLRKLRIKE
jgi:hypothetical protein